MLRQLVDCISWFREELTSWDLSIHLLSCRLQGLQRFVLQNSTFNVAHSVSNTFFDPAGQCGSWLWNYLSEGMSLLWWDDHKVLFECIPLGSVTDAWWHQAKACGRLENRLVQENKTSPFGSCFCILLQSTLFTMPCLFSIYGFFPRLHRRTARHWIFNFLVFACPWAW